MNQASSWFSSSQRTWGTRSPQRLDMRDVHRSGGSTTWVSTSTMRDVGEDVVTEALLLSVGPDDTDGNRLGSR